MKAIHKIASVIITILVLCFINVFIIHNVALVSAESYESSVGLSFTLNPTITVSVSGDLSINNLSPGDYKDSNIILVTAESNAVSGYSLTSTVGNSTHTSPSFNNTNLNHTNGTNTFTNLSTNKASLSAFDENTNTWGYSWCIGTCNAGTDPSLWVSGNLGSTATGYNGLPLYSSSNAITMVDTTAPGSSTISFKIGARSTTSQIAGEYTNIINFTALAKPNPEIPTMQNLNPSLCTSTPRMVLDSRDNQYYLVARAADDNCWMLQNLKLGYNTNSLELTSATSNVGSNGFTLTNKLDDGKFHAYTIDNIQYQNNSSEYYCTEDYGCYYNWYTATASSGTTYVAEGNVDYSICPAGWTLPTGGSGGQFQTLANSYNNSASAILVDNPTTVTENTTGKIPGFLLGGVYTDSGPYNISSVSYCWSRTAASGYQNGYRLRILTSGVDSANNDKKFVGLSVRCLLSS